jgi:thiol:disulfide interchange protein
MFLLHFLPDWLLSGFVNTVLISGAVLTVISFFTSWIPFINQYRIPVQVIGTILLTCGVYFKGGETAELAWRERTVELQQKIDAAQVKSAEATRRLDQEVKKSKQVVRDNTQAIKKEIAQNAQQLDSECRVSDAAISIHNEAALNKKPKVTVTFDGKIQNAK